MSTIKIDPRRLYANEKTVVSEDRCKQIYLLAMSTRQIAGCAAEVGVYRGGTARLICEALPRKQVYLFETFTGLPAPTVQDNTHKEGDFATTTLTEVHDFLAPLENYNLYKGYFPLQHSEVAADKKFAFVHIDVDLFMSTMRCLEFFYPRMSPGGIIVMDDYEAPTCNGATEAIKEFFENKPEAVESRTQYQAYIRRQCD